MQSIDSSLMKKAALSAFKDTTDSPGLRQKNNKLTSINEFKIQPENFNDNFVELRRATSYSGAQTTHEEDETNNSEVADYLIGHTRTLTGKHRHLLQA